MAWGRIRFSRVRGPAAETDALAGAAAWRLGGLTLRELGRLVWSEILEDELLDRAAALSYYLLFALFPALLFLTALLGLLPLALMDRLLAYADRALPGDADTLIRKTLVEVVRGAGGGLVSLGMVGALWTASSGMAAVMNTMNVVFETEDRRPWWKFRLVALVLTAGFCLLVPAALVLLVFGERIAHALARRVGLDPALAAAWAVARWPLVIGLVLTAIGLVYYLAPARRPRWHWVTPGSVFALAGWLLVSLGLRVYVDHLGSFNATYGSIGGVIVLLTWLYLTGLVLLVGGEIDAEIARAASHRLPGAGHQG